MIRTAILALIAGPAFADVQVLCTPYLDLVATLDGQYGERELAVAQTDQGPVMLVFVSPHGSWTMAILTADKMACPFAAGTNFKYVMMGEMN